MISYWGIDHGDEISKAKGDVDGKPYTPWRGFRAQGLAYESKGARARTGKAQAKHYYSRKAAKPLAGGTAAGAGAGAAVGALATRSAGGAKSGAVLGGAAGLYGGAMHHSNNSARHAVNTGLARGDIVRRPSNEITAFGGTRRKKS
jgi:hypothetical protein